MTEPGPLSAAYRGLLLRGVALEHRRKEIGREDLWLPW
jgi:hypothetical protein